MDDIFFCARIGVDCIKNNPENIKNGEQKYEGFVFNVKRDDADDIIQFIKEKLNEFGVPYEDVYVFSSLSLPLVMINTKEDIEEEIKNKSKYFIKESELRSRKK